MKISNDVKTIETLFTYSKKAVWKNTPSSPNAFRKAEYIVPHETCMRGPYIDK